MMSNKSRDTKTSLSKVNKSVVDDPQPPNLQSNKDQKTYNSNSNHDQSNNTSSYSSASSSDNTTTTSKVSSPSEHSSYTSNSSSSSNSSPSNNNTKNKNPINHTSSSANNNNNDHILTPMASASATGANTAHLPAYMNYYPYIAQTTPLAAGSFPGQLDVNTAASWPQAMAAAAAAMALANNDPLAVAAYMNATSNYTELSYDQYRFGAYGGTPAAYAYQGSYGSPPDFAQPNASTWVSNTSTQSPSNGLSADSSSAQQQSTHTTTNTAVTNNPSTNATSKWMHLDVPQQHDLTTQISPIYNEFTSRYSSNHYHASYHHQHHHNLQSSHHNGNRHHYNTVNNNNLYNTNPYFNYYNKYNSGTNSCHVNKLDADLANLHLMNTNNGSLMPNPISNRYFKSSNGGPNSNRFNSYRPRNSKHQQHNNNHNYNYQNGTSTSTEAQEPQENQQQDQQIQSYEMNENKTNDEEKQREEYEEHQIKYESNSSNDSLKSDSKKSWASIVGPPQAQKQSKAGKSLASIVPLISSKETTNSSQHQQHQVSDPNTKPPYSFNYHKNKSSFRSSFTRPQEPKYDFCLNNGAFPPINTDATTTTAEKTFIVVKGETKPEELASHTHPKSTYFTKLNYKKQQYNQYQKYQQKQFQRPARDEKFAFSKHKPDSISSSSYAKRNQPSQPTIFSFITKLDKKLFIDNNNNNNKGTGVKSEIRNGELTSISSTKVLSTAANNTIIPTSASTITNTQTSNQTSINIKEHKIDPNEYNPSEFNIEPRAARFFVIKSYSEDDVHRSIKYNIWCSTEHGNRRLDSAYMKSDNGHVPVYLFFSVNGSGHFCGMAEMTSRVDYNVKTDVWSQDKWRGCFQVKWIYVKDVPNSMLRNIKLENNDNKPVTNSRDTQEIPFDKGVQVLNIFHTYQHTSSIFEDFEHYEQAKVTTSNDNQIEMRAANNLCPSSESPSCSSSSAASSSSADDSKEDLLIHQPSSSHLIKSTS